MKRASWPVVGRGCLKCIKTLADRLVCSVALTVLAPLLVAEALAVVLDSGGPVFFLQKRIGLQGRTFRIVKFRTMTRDAHRQVLAQDQLG
jgi:lipopolysaccharide/colanic/teichoic acid biosynthesis glycosyltransferase